MKRENLKDKYFETFMNEYVKVIYDNNGKLVVTVLLFSETQVSLSRVVYTGNIEEVIKVYEVIHITVNRGSGFQQKM